MPRSKIWTRLVAGGAWLCAACGVLAATWTGGGANGLWTTTVNGGQLLVNGTHNGADAYTVNSGGILGGRGTIGSAVTVNGGGTLTPGGTNTTAIFTVNNAITFKDGSTFRVDIKGATPGTGYDQVSTTGALQLGGATLVPVVAAGCAPADGTVFTIITGQASIAGTFAGLPEGGQVSAGDWAFAVHYDAAGKKITLTSRRLSIGTVLMVK